MRFEIRKKEGNVLFNGALNAFYLRLYGVGHMIEDHSDNERGIPLSPHGLLFPFSSKFFFFKYAPSHRQDSTAFVTPIVEHWLEQEIAQLVHHEGSYHGATYRNTEVIKTCRICVQFASPFATVLAREFQDCMH